MCLLVWKTAGCILCFMSGISLSLLSCIFFCLEQHTYVYVWTTTFYLEKVIKSVCGGRA